MTGDGHTITPFFTSTGDVCSSFPAYTLFQVPMSTPPSEEQEKAHMYVSIRIKGHLDPGLWQDYLGGLQIIHEIDGASQLCGMLPDQPALYGVLNKLAHLSVTLLSLESSDPTPSEDS